MPVNRSCGVERLLAACRAYFETTGRRISFEYAMIDGVNDSDAAARLLASRLAGTGSHVNLIPLNHVEESPLKPSSRARVRRFQEILESQGITATVRRTLNGGNVTVLFSLSGAIATVMTADMGSVAYSSCHLIV